MATIKTENAKVILKGGRASCTCCGPASLGCDVGTCASPFQSISYEDAAALRAGGTFALTATYAVSTSYDIEILSQRRTAILSGTSSTTVNRTGTGSCNYSIRLQQTVANSGGILVIPDNVFVPSTTGNIDFIVSLSLNETNTSPRSFCLRVGASGLFGGIYGGAQTTNTCTASTTQVCTDNLTSATFGLFSATASGRIFASGFEVRTPTNFTGSASSSLVLTFTPSAP